MQDSPLLRDGRTDYLDVEEAATRARLRQLGQMIGDHSKSFEVLQVEELAAIRAERETLRAIEEGTKRGAARALAKTPKTVAHTSMVHRVKDAEQNPFAQALEEANGNTTIAYATLLRWADDERLPFLAAVAGSIKMQDGTVLSKRAIYQRLNRLKRKT